MKRRTIYHEEGWTVYQPDWYLSEGPIYAVHEDTGQVFGIECQIAIDDNTHGVYRVCDKPELPVSWVVVDSAQEAHRLTGKSFTNAVDAGMIRVHGAIHGLEDVGGSRLGSLFC